MQAMQVKIGGGLLAALSWALAVVACSGAPPPPPPSGTPPATPVSSPPAPTSSATAAAPAAPPERACKLPAPKKSGDPCKADADCAPSAYCHAPACVAAAKAPSKPQNVMCTDVFLCETADANRCGCYEGSCALIPPP